MNLLQYNLRQQLQKLIRSSLSENELSKLVQFSRSIIQSYLQYIRSSLVNLCSYQGLTIVDLSYDCIAEAFARDERGAFCHLENFVSVFQRDFETVPDKEVFLAYKSLLIRIADAQLARLYAQADPTGAKIHRNVRDCVKQSLLFILEKDYRGLVLRPKNSIESELRSAFPMEELEKEFLNRIDHIGTTQQMLQLCHEILTEQPTYRQSIPLVDLVQIFKKVYGGKTESIAQDHPFAFDGLTKFEIDQIRTQVEIALKEKIVLTYLARGKLNRKEAETVFNAFQDILEDWCNGEQSQSSLYHYLNEYLPMAEALYENTLRTKMEYLLKVAREEFAARLMRNV
jgi:hypothetical protein